MVRFENLSKAFHEGDRPRLVLDAASYRLEAGTFSALLGRSGSGKSTLLHLLAGLDRPDQGQIWCDDTELTGLSEDALTLFRRRHIGFVFQFFHLFPTLSVEENVGLSLELSGVQGHIQPLLERVGLWDRRRAYPDRLSGGEQQRVAVARALVHRPRLLLADEPTGNLDAETGASVLQLLRELSSDFGTTLLVATHSPEVAAAADQVLEVRGGQVVVRR